MLTAPPLAVLRDKTMRSLIDTCLPGVGVTAEERARIFRLAWDVTGSAPVSRNQQYERFYLSSAIRKMA